MGNPAQLVTATARNGGKLAAAGRFFGRLFGWSKTAKSAAPAVAKAAPAVTKAAKPGVLSKTGAFMKETGKWGLISSLLGGGDTSVINVGGQSAGVGSGIFSGIANLLGSKLHSALSPLTSGKILSSIASSISGLVRAASISNNQTESGGSEPNILHQILSVLNKISNTQDSILGVTSNIESTQNTLAQPTIESNEILSSGVPKLLKATYATAENTEKSAILAEEEIKAQQSPLDSFNSIGGIIGSAVEEGMTKGSSGFWSTLGKWVLGGAAVGLGGAIAGPAAAKAVGLASARAIDGAPAVDPIKSARSAAVHGLDDVKVANSLVDTKSLVKAGVITEKQAAKLGTKIPISKLASELGVTSTEAASRAVSAGVRVAGIERSLVGAGTKAGAAFGLKSATKGLAGVGIAVDAGFHGYEAWMAQQDEDFAKRNEAIAGGVGSIGGGILGGMAAGAILGAAGGSVTGPGAIVTGAIGMIVGGILGEEGMRALVSSMQEESTKMKVLNAHQEVVKLSEKSEEEKETNEQLEREKILYEKEAERFEKQKKQIEESQMSDEEKTAALERLSESYHQSERLRKYKINLLEKEYHDAEEKRLLKLKEAAEKLNQAIEADTWKSDWKETNNLTYHSGSGNVKDLSVSIGATKTSGLYYRDDSMWSRGDALFNGKRVRLIRDADEWNKAWKEFCLFYEKNGSKAIEDNEIKRALDSMINDFAYAKNEIEHKRTSFGGTSATEKILWAQVKEKERQFQEKQSTAGTAPDSAASSVTQPPQTSSQNQQNNFDGSTSALTPDLLTPTNTPQTDSLIYNQPGKPNIEAEDALNATAEATINSEQTLRQVEKNLRTLIDLAQPTSQPTTSTYTPDGGNIR